MPRQPTIRPASPAASEIPATPSRSPILEITKTSPAESHGPTFQLSSPTSGEQAIDALDLSNLSIGGKSNLEEDEEEHRDPDDSNQDTFETIDEKAHRADTAMSWFKLVCKHQVASNSFMITRGARSSVIRHLSPENISVEPEHKDDQTEQPSDFLRAFKMPDGRSLTEEEQKIILGRLTLLATKGKQVSRGT